VGDNITGRILMTPKKISADDRRLIQQMCQHLLMDFLQYAHERQLMDKNLKSIFLEIERFVEERLGLRGSAEEGDE
jgi:hypothetical protein